MKLYLVSNNCVLNNLSYKNSESLDLKREKDHLVSKAKEKQEN